MDIDDASLRDAYEFWEGGRPVEAGRIIFETIEPHDRPKWAVTILRLADERKTSDLAAVQQLLRIADNVADWPKAKQVFSMLRSEVLNLEKLHMLSDAQIECIHLLYLAENVAKVIYNATNPPDEFDEDSGWWVAGCLRSYVDNLKDDAFAQKAWAALAMYSA